MHRENWLTRKHILDEYDAQVAAMRDSLSDRILLSDHQRGRISDPREFQKLWNAEFTNTDLYHTLVAEGKRVPWGWVNPRDA